MKLQLTWIFIFLAILSIGHVAIADSPDIVTLPQIMPLFRPVQDWPLGKYWTGKTIGVKDFYLAEQGNYNRTTEQTSWPYYQTGFFPEFIPGHWALNVFNPDAKLVPWQETLVSQFLQNRWPLFSINYIQMQGCKTPTQSSIDRVNDVWIGDGQPEEPIYRLEPVFYYLATGKKWTGSSMYLWHDDVAVSYLKNELIPKLEERIPGCSSPNFKWSRQSLKTLRDTYCETYLSRSIRPIAWTMYLSPYAICEMPNIVTVASKGGDAYLLALQRGVARQSGGGKFLLCWRGHEPMERYAYLKGNIFNRPERENWGYPLPYIKYYIFRPYLLGENYYMNEGFPGALIHDMDDNGTYHPTVLGRITKDLMDYTHRQPNRGTVYTPVALVQGWDRGDDQHYYGKIPFDHADWMNYALLNDLFLPTHREARNTGEYMRTSPFGEIFDLLKPNPGKPVDPDIFDGYKVLVLMGGITFSDQYKAALHDYVRNGGIIVINAADAKDTLDSAFTGVTVGDCFKASQGVRSATGKQFSEKEFDCRRLILHDANVLYSAGDQPVVTSHVFGAGQVVVTAPEYMLAAGTTLTIEGQSKKSTDRPMLLTFWSDFFDGLFASVSPFEVRVRPEDRPDISWSICKKGDQWTLALYDYSLKREELVHDSVSVADVTAEYPYKAIPVEICSRFPAADVVELFEGRDVVVEQVDGRARIRVMCRGGDIRVYQFSRTRTPLPAYTQSVNYAMNKPVHASSVYSGYSADYVVDGKEINFNFWQSADKNGVFETPQWLTVDLQQPERIDHVKLIFHVWEPSDQTVRQNIYKYQVQVSMDGNEWQTVIDESGNGEPAQLGGEETWFKPVKARYVKLLVLRNSSNGGAQVVELSVMGDKTEQYEPKRKPVRVSLSQLLPRNVTDTPPEKTRYLTRLEPLDVKPGWMPAGVTWNALNGGVTLYGEAGTGETLACPESLYGESVFEASYAIPSGAQYFVSVCGFGNRERVASVEFQVFVDGQLKYNSGVYRAGQTPLPVVVNVEGGKKLHLVTTDAGDGIAFDYAWWGDARFILK